MIRILLGQRGSLLRGALTAMLSREADITVVAALGQRDVLVQAAARERPNVAVLDFMLPGSISLSDLCRTLRRTVPACPVLIMMDRTACASGGGSLAKLAPHVGLIATESSPDHLVESIRSLDRGETVLDADLAVAVLKSGQNPLTKREQEVLRLAEAGAPAKEIAHQLFLNVGTVRNYLSRILAKTGARTRIEAIRIAQDAGWI